MSKHIILGDVHLGKGAGIGKPGSGGKLNSRIQDQLNLLDWVLQTAIDNNVYSIIITGDIYEEPRPHPALIQFFMAWLKHCEKEGIQVDIIVGNHDIVKTGSYTVSALDIIPAVELTHATTHKDITTLHFDGVSFTLLPYRDRRMYDADSPQTALNLLIDEFKDEAGKIPSDNRRVLIGHFALKGALYVGDELDDMLNEIFCPLTIFKDWEYVWMGHIHKPQVMLQSPYIAHIGSMDRSDFGKGETGHDKVIILFDSDKKVPFEEIVIPTRSLRKVEIAVPSDKDSTDFVINELHALNNEQTLNESIVRIEIQLEGTETLNVDRDKVYKFVYEHLGAHYICNFSESRNISIISKKQAALFDNNVSIPSAIDAYIDSMELDSEDEREEARQLAQFCYRELESKIKESVAA